MVLHAGKIQDGGIFCPVVQDALVALIPYDDKIVLDRHFADRLDGRGVIDGACGIVGRVDDDGDGLVGDRGAHGLGLYHEVVALFGLDKDGNAAQDLGHVAIVHPVRGRDDDLVAGIDKAAERQEEAFHGSDGDLDLRVGVIADLRLVFNPGRNDLPELGYARVGRVLGLARHDRVATGLLHVIGRLVVGISQREVDDVVILLGHVEQSPGQGRLDSLCHV